MSGKLVQNENGEWEEPPGHAALWHWFGLSRASWLTLPRSVMHEMPDEWQGKMAQLLHEYDAATRNQPEDVAGLTPLVMARSWKRNRRWPAWLLNYRCPDPKNFEWMSPPVE